MKGSPTSVSYTHLQSITSPAQSGRCCFRSRERFSLAEFVLTVSSPAPVAAPVPRGIAVRSRGAVSYTHLTGR